MGAAVDWRAAPLKAGAPLDGAFAPSFSSPGRSPRREESQQATAKHSGRLETRAARRPNVGPHRPQDHVPSERVRLATLVDRARTHGVGRPPTDHKSRVHEGGRRDRLCHADRCDLEGQRVLPAVGLEHDRRSVRSRPRHRVHGSSRIRLPLCPGAEDRPPPCDEPDALTVGANDRDCVRSSEDDGVDATRVGSFDDLRSGRDG